MTDPRLPSLVPVHCPDCPVADRPLLWVGEDVAMFVVILESQMRPGDDIRAGMMCERCGQRWAVKVLALRAEDRD